VPEDFKQVLKAKAERIQQTLPTIKEVIQERVESEGVPLSVVGEVTDVMTPELAAEELMRYLPLETQELIREAKHSAEQDLWKMLLGYVMRCADRHELFAPYILSMWDTQSKPGEARPCKKCGGQFATRFHDASFCCANCYFEKAEFRGHSENCLITQSSVKV